MPPAHADAAKGFHESLYRQKLAALLEKKKLSDGDDEELKKMQVGAVDAAAAGCWALEGEGSAGVRGGS